MPVCGTQANYAAGCHCEECRAAHAAQAKARRDRRKAGIVTPDDRVPADATRKALKWMRAQGMRWRQIENITGMDRTTMTRATLPGKLVVAVHTQSIILETEQLVRANPDLITRDALRFPAAWSLWQVRALLARGWTRDFIIEQTGLASLPTSQRKWVNRPTWATLNEFFSDYHAQWGPSRTGAIVMWRQGYLPPDCYDWEEGDTRAIPGSLHPDLFNEAVTFTRLHKDSAKLVAARLHTLQQWGDPLCAAKAYREWCSLLARPVGRGMEDWCRDPEHDHSAPQAWRKRGRAVAKVVPLAKGA